MENPDIFEREFNKHTESVEFRKKSELERLEDFKDFRPADGSEYGKRWMFKNGYGISVVRGFGTYGAKEGLFEIAVMKGTKNDNHLCYDTKITNDVIGHLTSKQVLSIGKRILKL